jgi:hypothetical protein
MAGLAMSLAARDHRVPNDRKLTVRAASANPRLSGTIRIFIA